MGILHSLILGVVEGITEFLPISSTGHLILASHWLGLSTSDFLKSFEIIIQLGAILAVVILYWRSLFNWANIKKLIVAFVPTGLIGLALYKILKTYLLGNTAVVLWAMLLGGVVLIVFELIHKASAEGEAGIEQISYRQAFIIGLCQSVAIIPGVSRAAATIVGGLFLGIRRKTIVEFSFLLAVPTMLAATGLDLIKNAATFSASQFSVLSVGFVAAFLVALASIKWLIGFIKNHSFVPFGVYRILAALFGWLAR